MSWRIQNLPDSQTNPSGPAPGGGGERGERDRGGKKSKSKSTSDGRGAIKRLIKELDVWRSEKKEERGIERLGPVDDDDLLTWEAVVNGRGIGNGYDGRFFFVFFFLAQSLLLPSQKCSPWTFLSFASSGLIANVFKKQRAAGSYTSRSRQTIPFVRRRYASRRPWCTPTLPCRRARSASTCSRTPGRRPTASSRACAPCARCWPTRRRTRRSTSTLRRCCAAGTCWAPARSSSFGAAMTRGVMRGREENCSLPTLRKRDSGVKYGSVLCWMTARGVMVNWEEPLCPVGGPM